jgi:hypothetical protein
MYGRIKFSDNPWPKGHPLKDFYLGILIHEPKGDLPARATLDVRFRSENYYYPYSYEEMPDASKDQTAKSKKISSSWEKIDTWLNHDSAYSNSISNHDAMVLADENDGFDLEYLDDFNRVIEPIQQTLPDDDSHYKIPAYHSHILTRDDMVVHNIHISCDSESGLYDIIWIGNCGKANKGNFRYQHEFELQAAGIPFGGYCGHKLSWDEQATKTPEEQDIELRTLVESIVINPGKMQFKIGQYSHRDRLLPS